MSGLTAGAYILRGGHDVLILEKTSGVGGLMGFAWFKYRTPESPVNKEFESIPDYFPPESSFGDWTGGVS